MPNNPNGNQNLRWPGAGRRVVSPQRPIQPTGFEPLAAMAQSWMAKQQAETGAQQRMMAGAFPALIAAQARGWEPRTMEEALKLKRAKAAPTQWDIQKEARQSISTMLRDNPRLQMRVFTDPSIMTDLVDAEVVRLSEKYTGEGVKPTVTPTPTPTPIAKPKGKRVRMRSPDGRPFTIEQSEVKEAIAHGWKRG